MAENKNDTSDYYCLLNCNPVTVFEILDLLKKKNFQSYKSLRI